MTPEARPKTEIVDDTEEDGDSAENEPFSQDEIVQTTRLAREHALDTSTLTEIEMLPTKTRNSRVTDVHGNGPLWHRAGSYSLLVPA